MPLLLAPRLFWVTARTRVYAREEKLEERNDCGNCAAIRGNFGLKIVRARRARRARFDPEDQSPGLFSSASLGCS